MPRHPTHAIHGPRFTAKQKEVLDAIGYALERGMIDFVTATDWGDQVKAGRVDEVAEVLGELPHNNPFKLEPTDN